MIFFIICYVMTTMATLLYVPRMAPPFRDHPAWGLVAVLNMLAIANMPREIYHKRDFNAFLSSLRRDSVPDGAAGDRAVSRT